MKLTPEEITDLYLSNVPPSLNDSGERTDIPVDAILAQRGTRYGSFQTHSTLSQTLQDKIFEHAHVHQFSPMESYMKESITLICHKLARIANGDPYYDDNWKDIAGYAQLVVDILQNKDI